MSQPILLEICPLCAGDVHEVRAPVDVRVGQRTVAVTVEHQKCEKCGESFFQPGQINEMQRGAANTIRRAEKLLMPEQIREIRENLDLTQAQFERLLGVGPKTVVRWERGTVFQNGATDRLLRVIAAVPKAVEYLTRLCGLKDSRKYTVLTDVVEWEPRVSYHYVAPVGAIVTARPVHQGDVTPIAPYLKSRESRARVRELPLESSLYKESIG